MYGSKCQEMETDHMYRFRGLLSRMGSEQLGTKNMRQHRTIFLSHHTKFVRANTLSIEAWSLPEESIDSEKHIERGHKSHRICE